MYVIAIANQKGGSGKTTTAVNLSACLAEKNRKILLIDLDPQAQASTSWRVEEMESKGTIFDALLETRDGGTSLADLGLEVHDGLTLVPSRSLSQDDESRLFSHPKRSSKLHELLEGVKDSYDFSIIDCPPTMVGLLMQNALSVSNAAILTVETTFLSLHSAGQMLETIQNIRRRHPIRVFALATRYDRRTTNANEILENMQECFGDMMLKTVIRENVRIKEAAGYGEPITVSARNSYGAQDYTALAEELVKKIGKSKQPKN